MTVLLEHILMTAQLEYLDPFTKIKSANAGSVGLWILVLTHYTAQLEYLDPFTKIKSANAGSVGLWILVLIHYTAFRIKNCS